MGTRTSTGVVAEFTYGIRRILAHLACRVLRQSISTAEARHSRAIANSKAMPALEAYLLRIRLRVPLPFEGNNNNYYYFLRPAFDFPQFDFGIDSGVVGALARVWPQLEQPTGRYTLIVIMPMIARLTRPAVQRECW